MATLRRDLENTTHLKGDLERRLETAQAEAGLVKSRFEDLQFKFDESTKSMCALSEFNTNLRVESVRHEGQCQLLLEAESVFKRQASANEMELMHCRSTISVMEQEVLTSQNRVRDLERRLSETSRQITSLEASERDLQNLVCALRTEVADARARLLLTDVELNQAYEANQSRKQAEEIKRLEVAVQSYVHETDRLHTALIASEAKIESNSVELNELKAQAKVLKTQDLCLRQALIDYDKFNANCEKKITELEAVVDYLSTLLQSIVKWEKEMTSGNIAEKRVVQLRTLENSKLEDEIHDLRAESKDLRAQIAKTLEGSEGKASRVAQLEASQAETKAQIRSLQIRCEKAKDEYSEAQAENMRLKMLLQQADQAAMQLEIEVSKATQNEQTISEQQKAISMLTAESKDLRVQIVYLTKQLELAVADLEVEAKQTEHFTKSFLDLSRRLQDREDNNGQIQVLNVVSDSMTKIDSAKGSNGDSQQFL
jgi:chromosome segregation ATPase